MKQLKKLLSLVLIFVLALAPLNVQAASNKTKALKAYKKLLSAKNIRWGTNSYEPTVPAKNCQFALAYIDNDSVPELIVYNNKDVPHMVGYGLLYTYRSGKVRLLGYINIDNKLSYYKKKGVIVTSYVSGGTTYSYFKLSKTKITNKLAIGIDVLTQKKSYYTVSNDIFKKTSKSKFNKALKKLVGSKKKTTIKFRKNNASNRKKYIR